MVNRSQHWLNQAIRDLQQAEDSRKVGRHEWEEMRKEGRRFRQTVEQEAVWIYENKEGA